MTGNIRRTCPIGIAVMLGAFLALAVGCSSGSSGKRSSTGPTTPDPDVHELNDSRGGCSPISLDFSLASLSLHNAFDVDFFCFPIPLESDLSAILTFDDTVGPVAMELLDGADAVVATSAPQPGGATLTVPMLTCDDYALRVWSPTGTPIPYALDVTRVELQSPLALDGNEPDDDPASCTPIPDPRLGVVSLPGLSLHDGLNEDWFCFPLGAQADIEVSLIGLSTIGAMNAELLDSGLNVIASGSLFNAIIPAGSYFIRVFPGNCGRVQYTLTVSEV